MVGGKSLIAKPGQKVFFNYLTRLHRGSNKITFVAKNGKGIAAQRVIEVEYEAPQVRQVGSRMTLSMLPFYLKGQVNLAEVAYEDLLKSITEGGRFKMVDRSIIEKVIREMQLTQAGLTDQASSVKAGKLTRAEVVLLGFVTETPRSIEVYARLVDVETSRILTEKDAYMESRPLSLKDLISLMDGLSVKIRNQFPLVEGVISEISGKNLTAQISLRTPLQTGLRLIIFKEKQVLHPETKKPLGIQTLPVCEARIIGVQGANISAQVVNSQDLKKVTGSDKVITK